MCCDCGFTCQSLRIGDRLGFSQMHYKHPKKCQIDEYNFVIDSRSVLNLGEKACTILVLISQPSDSMIGTQSEKCLSLTVATVKRAVKGHFYGVDTSVSGAQRLGRNPKVTVVRHADTLCACTTPKKKRQVDELIAILM